jgi:hypothetical protein
VTADARDASAHRILRGPLGVGNETRKSGNVGKSKSETKSEIAVRGTQGRIPARGAAFGGILFDRTSQRDREVRNTVRYVRSYETKMDTPRGQTARIVRRGGLADIDRTIYTDRHFSTPDTQYMYILASRAVQAALGRVVEVDLPSGAPMISAAQAPRSLVALVERPAPGFDCTAPPSRLCVLFVHANGLPFL